MVVTLQRITAGVRPLRDRISASGGRRMRNAFGAAIMFASVLVVLGGLAWHYDSVVYWLPLVNSAALQAMLPESESARPRSIVAGHAITSVIGLTIGLMFAGSILAALAAAVMGVFFMKLVRAPHPPAAVTALVLVLHPVSQPWQVPLLVAGAVALSGLAAAIRSIPTSGLAARHARLGERGTS